MVGRTRHGMNLFAAIVGDTSRSRKRDGWTHVDQLFTAADTPLRALRGSELPFSRPFAERLTNGVNTGEGLMFTIRDAGHVLADGDVDSTGIEDKRLLLVETELAQLLMACQRYKNTLIPVLCQAWDGTRLAAITKNPLRATDPHISVIGHITTDDVRGLLPAAQQQNGFTNRFLRCMADRARTIANPKPVPEPAWTQLIDRTREAIQLGMTVSRMTHDSEYAYRWEAVYPSLFADVPGSGGAVLARAEAQVTRLAGIYALLDHSGTIRADHLEAALGLWRFCAASAAVIFGSERKLAPAKGDALLTRMQTIHNHLCAATDGLTRTDISHPFRGNVSSDDLQAALDGLQAVNRARVEQDGAGARGGRRAERWFAIQTTNSSRKAA
jgi:hypothetical protein